MMRLTSSDRARERGGRARGCSSAALVAARCGRSRRRGEDADVHQGHRADLPGEVRSVSPARLDRADVAHDLRRGAAVGALDQGARRRPPDAAVADRSDVGIQKFKNDRSLTDEQIETIVRWVDAGAPQGDPKDMPAAEAVARRPGLELRGGVRPERAGPDHQVARLHDAGRVAGRVGQARHAVGHHRAALGSRDRDPARDAEGPQDHASRDRVPRTDRAGRRRAVPGLPTPFMEWAVGKQGEMMRPGHRQAAAAGFEVPLGYPLLAGRRRDHQQGGDGHLLLPEGAGAEVPQRRCRSSRPRSARWTSVRTASRSRKASRRSARRPASKASSRTCTCAARR